jgi:transposase
MRRTYSEDIKKKMVRRMMGPNRLSASALSKQVGIPQPTLSKWLKQMVTMALNPNMPDAAAEFHETQEASSAKIIEMPKKWTVEEKLRVLAAAYGLTGEALGALLRQEGLHETQLKEWQEATASALKGAPDASRSMTAGEKRRAAAAAKRIKELERELRRKDKALAETAGLLLFEKKLKEVGWDEGDDGTGGKSGA